MMVFHATIASRPPAETEMSIKMKRCEVVPSMAEWETRCCDAGNAGVRLPKNNGRTGIRGCMVMLHLLFLFVEFRRYHGAGGNHNVAIVAERDVSLLIAAASAAEGVEIEVHEITNPPRRR
jgi:hypothetical protein